MKTVVKILLIIVMPLLMLMCALSINVRGQFLSSEFWINTFREDGVYQKISEIIGDKLTDKVLESGGKKTDVKDLSGLISESSLRSFSEKNIEGILRYANKKDKELTIYVPILSEETLNTDKVKNLEAYFKEVSIDTFLNEYNVSGIRSEDFNNLSRVGAFSWIILIFSYTLLMLSIYYLIHLTKEGKRFISLGIPFMFSGITFFALYFVGNFIINLLNLRYVESTNIGTLFIAILAPSVIVKVIEIWMWFGVSSLAIGTMLFFIKKPAKTRQK